MNLKNKGITAERELQHMIWKRGWAAHRIAGSGSSRYPSPDIIAGNGGRIIAIECKTCKGKYQYFSKKEIRELETFSSMFGAEALIAVKFKSKGWCLVKTPHLKEGEKNFVLSVEMAEIFAKNVDDIFN